MRRDKIVDKNALAIELKGIREHFKTYDPKMPKELFDELDKEEERFKKE